MTKLEDSYRDTYGNVLHTILDSSDEFSSGFSINDYKSPKQKLYKEIDENLILKEVMNVCWVIYTWEH